MQGATSKPGSKFIQCHQEGSECLPPWSPLFPFFLFFLFVCSFKGCILLQPGQFRHWCGGIGSCSYTFSIWRLLFVMAKITVYHNGIYQTISAALLELGIQFCSSSQSLGSFLQKQYIGSIVLLNDITFHEFWRVFSVFPTVASLLLPFPYKWYDVACKYPCKFAGHKIAWYDWLKSYHCIVS